jgi:proline racemase
MMLVGSRGWIETPVGTVKSILHDSGEVTIENVPSYRAASKISLTIGTRIIGNALGELE